MSNSERIHETATRGIDIKRTTLQSKRMLDGGRRCGYTTIWGRGLEHQSINF